MNPQQLFVHAITPLERFLKTDIRYLASGSFWLSISSVTGMLIAFILSVAYARYLPKEIYGSYRFILSAIGMAGIFSLPGMSTAIVRAAARGYDGTFRKGSYLIFLSSFGISLVGFVTAILFFVKGNAPVAYGLCIASILVPFMEGLGNWRGYLDGKKEFQKKTLCNILSHAVYALIMLGTIAVIYVNEFSLAMDVVLLTLAYFASHALPNVVLHWNIIRSIPKNAPQEESAIAYGLRLSLSSAPSTLANYIDSVLLYSFLGPAALAVYSFAIALPEQVKSFMGNIATVTFSKLAVQAEGEESAESLKQTLPQKLFRATILTAVMVGGYIITAPFIYTLFFPRYMDSVIYSQIFALSLILFPFGVFGDALKAEGNIHKIYIHNIGAPLLQIIALLLLVPFYDLWGAVAGRVIGRFLNHILAYVLFKLP